MKLTKEQLIDIIREVMTELEEGKKKKVVRKGKVVKKTVCGKGQKAKGGKCVAMKSKERSKRKMKAKKSAVKRKAKGTKIKKKTKKSMRKRKQLGLK
jgi:hypothetical protein